MMDSSSRRLSIISSHLLPLTFTPSSSSSSRPSTRVSASTCFSSSHDHHDTKHTPSDRDSNYDCVFCKIVRGDSPSLKIYEDDKCLCILDTKPLTHGHSLIIPKTHYPSLEVTPPSVVAAMCSKVPIIGSAIMRATCCDSFNLLVNNGAAAGQVIFHTHIHIIPRKRSDCLWTSESLHRRPLNFDQRVSDLVDCVREHLSIVDVSQDSTDHEASLPLNYGPK